MIYTSYFAFVNRLGLGNSNVISIARHSPTWFGAWWDHREYLDLAPSKSILMEYRGSNRTDKVQIYTDRYESEILAKLDPNIVVKDLGVDPILLCYEPRDMFCHRHIVADWLIKAGFEVLELK